MFFEMFGPESKKQRIWCCKIMRFEFFYKKLLFVRIRPQSVIWGWGSETLLGVLKRLSQILRRTPKVLGNLLKDLEGFWSFFWSFRKFTKKKSISKRFSCIFLCRELIGEIEKISLLSATCMVKNTPCKCIKNTKFYFHCFLLKKRSQSIPILSQKSSYNGL